MSFVKQDHIICHHGNLVSWKQESKDIRAHCGAKPGSDAGTSVFVQTGGDLNLDVTENDVPKDFIIFLWKFGTKGVVVTFYPNKQPQVQSPYTGRIESFENKFSVKLKNLQKKDSGVYVARVTTAEEQILTEYNVTVQDPVSSVNLTVDSVSITPDSSSCNLTVTCRTVEQSISRTFSCINRICNQEPRDRSKVPNLGASLHVYLLNEVIFCNHSNQVSWTESNKTIQEFCPDILRLVSEEFEVRGKKTD
ncbi:uncharacterized protein LOC108232850 isoform X2 [Kryptolebias marmoratus]|uniref:uncharacterized protein LOC108232850 isoform X2 n=1 Tax=Kryptolebias marmoratus TaxID=37003 RepID=UPI000D5302C1|nr:uncharacterized protein LOC108232850 isoform X2 [Kryptolebias marmoratus]XP_024860565.1 uncharacterized protein LOC108232850 isoform X2 [Kryptolebias marmoratus]XP_037837944.1 uncharacterized protein LOC108232850 isoform X2 [Kryptolebias marmoratus]XP_037837945.1 uncharacterized protein LOC108232850 isoform X2 [Kryptolebias marmoratus]